MNGPPTAPTVDLRQGPPDLRRESMRGEGIGSSREICKHFKVNLSLFSVKGSAVSGPTVDPALVMPTPSRRVTQSHRLPTKHFSSSGFKSRAKSWGALGSGRDGNRRLMRKSLSSKGTCRVNHVSPFQIWAPIGIVPNLLQIRRLPSMQSLIVGDERKNLK